MIRRFTISMSTDADADIIAWLDGLPARGRSDAIRDVIRETINGGGGQGDDVLADRVADRVLERLEGRFIRIADGADPGAEWTNVDPVILDNLEQIGG